MLDLDAEDLAPFRPALLAWLDQHGAEAVLCVRPGSAMLFGAGAPGALLDAWEQSLQSRSVPPTLAASAGMTAARSPQQSTGPRGPRRR